MHMLNKEMQHLGPTGVSARVSRAQGGEGSVRGERCLAATPPHVPELRVCVYEALNAV